MPQQSFSTIPSPDDLIEREKEKDEPIIQPKQVGPAGPSLITEDEAVAAQKLWLQTDDENYKKKATTLVSKYVQQQKRLGEKAFPNSAKEKQRKAFGEARKAFTSPTYGLDPDKAGKIEESFRGDKDAVKTFFTGRYFQAQNPEITDDILDGYLPDLIAQYSEEVFGEKIEDAPAFFDRLGQDINFSDNDILKAAREAGVRGYDSIRTAELLEERFAGNPLYEGRESKWGEIAESAREKIHGSLTNEERELMLWTHDQMELRTGVREGEVLGEVTVGRRTRDKVEKPSSYAEMAERWADLPEDRVKFLLGNFDVLSDGVDKDYGKKLAENFGRGVQDLGYGPISTLKRTDIQAKLKYLKQENPLFYGTPETLDDITNIAYMRSAAGEDEILFTDVRPGSKADPELIQQGIEKLERQQKLLNIHNQMRQTAEIVVDPSRHDGLLGQGLLDAARSVPYTAMAMVPYVGMVVNSAAMADQGFYQLKEMGLSDENAHTASLIAAPFQGLAEKINAKIVLGKAPIVSDFFNKWVWNTTAPGRVVRGLERLASGTVTEMITENFQDVAPLLSAEIVEEFVDAAEQDFPDFEWRAIINDQIKRQPELFAAVLPLVLLGAGAGSIRDNLQLQQSLTQPELLRGFGINLDDALDISELAKSKKFTEAEAKLRESMANLGMDGRSLDEVATDGAIGAREAMKKMLESREQLDILQTAGLLPSIVQTEQGWGLVQEVRQKDGTFVEMQPATQFFKTFEEAKGRQHKILTERQVDLSEDTRTLLSHIEKNQGRGVRTRFMFSPESRTTQQEREEGGDKEQLRKREEQADREQAEGSQQDVSEIDDLGKKTEQEFKEAEAAAMAASQDEGDKEMIHLILGRSSHEFADGIFVRNVELFRGATLATVLEETSEADAGRIMGEMGMDFLLDKLRRFEEISGIVLFPEEGEIVESDVKEAYSSIVRSYFLTRSEDLGEVGQTYRQLFSNMIDSGLGGAMAAYRDIFRAMQRRAETIGKVREKEGIDPELEAMLEKSLGMQEGRMFTREVENEAVRMAEELTRGRQAPATFSTIAISPEMDADYMAAVKAGDMETAQRMVDEAAKAAGYDSPVVYHGSPNWTGAPDDFTKFLIRKTKSILSGFAYFAENKEIATSYATGVNAEGTIATGVVKAFYLRGSDSWKGIHTVENPNQIKSADPVTYDESGNVIPLSQRFDQGRDEITYSVLSTAKSDSDYLAAVESGDMEVVQRMVDEAVKAAGYDLSHRRGHKDSKLPTETGYVIQFAKRGENLEFGDKEYLIRKEDLTHLPGWIFEFAANWANENLPHKPDLSRDEAAYLLNSAPIVDDAMLWDEPSFIEALRNDPRTEGVPGYLAADGAVIIHPELIRLKSADPITYDADGNVIPLSQRFDQGRDEISYSVLSTAKSDSDYLAAVEAGDMEAAQRMVDEAAKAAGYTVGPVFHGTTPGDWTIFEVPDTGAMFATRESMAELFGHGRTRKKYYDENGTFEGAPDPRVIAAYLKPDDFREAHQFEFKQLKEEGVNTTKSDMDVWVVRRPNQIKSADPVTYDQSGNVIPLSQRFDATRDEITYSVLSPAKMLEAEVKGMSSDEVRDYLKNVKLTPTKEMVAMLGSYPEYLDPVIDYILEKREDLLNGETSPRDVAKAYWITIASIGADAIDVSTIKAHAVKHGIEFDPDPLYMAVGKKGQPQMRPEELAAYWLGTEDGQKALDNIEKGIFRKPDWESGLILRDAFGRNDLRSKKQPTKKNPEGTYKSGAVGIPKKNAFNLRNLQDAVEAIRDAKGNPEKLETALKRIVGIGEGKKGFIGHLLGFGEWATLDAVELNMWLTGEGETTYASKANKKRAAVAKRASGSKTESEDLFRRIRKRINNLRKTAEGGSKIPEEVAAHVIHHWIWDAGKGLKTTHEGVYHSMRTHSVMLVPANTLADQKGIPGTIPEEYVGKPFLPIMADLLSGGGKLFGVDVQGGPAYPLLHFDPNDPDKDTAAWASKEVGVRSIYQSLTKTKAYWTDEEGRRRALIAPYSMAQEAHKSNVTFQRIVFNAIEEAIRDGALSLEQEANLSELIREKAGSTKAGTEKLTRFPKKFSASKFESYISSLSFDERAFVIKTMNSAAAEEIGVIPIKRILNQARDQSFEGLETSSIISLIEVDYDALDAYFGKNKNVEKPDLSAAAFGVQEHLSYSHVIPGKLVSHLRRPIPLDLVGGRMLEDMAKKKPTSRPDYLLGRTLSTGIRAPLLEQDVVDTVNNAQNIPISRAEAQAMFNAVMDNWKVIDTSKQQGVVEFTRAIRQNEAGDTLTHYDPKEVGKWARDGHMKVFRLGDDDVYFAIKIGEYDEKTRKVTDTGRRELVGVTSNVATKGMLNLIMAKALSEGANVLDAFAVSNDRMPDGILPTLYGNHGWKVTQTFPYDPLYRDEGDTRTDKELLEEDKKRRKVWESQGWEESRHGLPPVVVMEHDGATTRRRTSEHAQSGVAARAIAKARKAAARTADGNLRDDTGGAFDSDPGGDAGTGGRLLPRKSDRLGRSIGGLDESGLRVLGLDKAGRDAALATLASGASYSALRMPKDYAEAQARVDQMLSPFQRSPKLRGEIVRNIRERAQEQLEKWVDIVEQQGLIEESRKEEIRLRAKKTVEDFVEEEEKAGRTVTDEERKKMLSEARKEAQIYYRQEAKDVTTLDREQLRAALRTIEAITMQAPPEVRGKLLRGSNRIASLKTPAAMLQEIERRVAKLDQELEYFLWKEAEETRKNLFRKIKRGDDRSAGKKRKGTLTAEFYELFEAADQAMAWDRAKGEIEAEKLQLEAETMESEDVSKMTPDQLEEHHNKIAKLELTAEMYRGFAGWMELDSILRFHAVDTLEELRVGAWEMRKQNEAKRREFLEEKRNEAWSDAKATGNVAELQNALNEAKKHRKGAQGLLTWDQLFDYWFGSESETYTYWTDRLRHAENLRHDLDQETGNLVQGLMQQIGGSKRNGMKVDWDLNQDIIETKEGNFTPMQSVDILLTWRQEDGRRHMMGPLDEEGNPRKGGREYWHYDQKFVDDLKRQLTEKAPAAIKVYKFLRKQYRKEWERINPLYREIYGVNLPKNIFYAPLKVQGVSETNRDQMDPTTGLTKSGTVTPNSLRSRGHAIARPTFVNALQKFSGHKRQINHFLAFAEFNRDAQAILGERSIQNGLTEKFGVESVNNLNFFLRFYRENGNTMAGAELGFNTDWLGKATSNFAQMAIVGRIGTIALQSSQLTAARAEMSAADYYSRIVKLFSGDLEMGWKEAWNSDYIQRRLEEMPPIVRQALQHNNVYDVPAWLDSAGLGDMARGFRRGTGNDLKYAVGNLGRTIAGADALFTAGTFAIIYDQRLSAAKAKGMPNPEKHALNEAERITDKVAQPTRPGARSSVELAFSANPLGALVFNFGSEARKNIGLMLVAAVTKDATRLGRSVAYAVILQGIMSAVIRNVWREARDSDDESYFDAQNQWARRFMLDAMTEWLYGVPIFGEEIQSMIYSLAGEYKYDSTPLSSIGRGATRIPRLLTGESIEDGTALRDLEGLIEGMGIFSDSAAASASFMHLFRDLSRLGENILTD